MSRTTSSQIYVNVVNKNDGTCCVGPPAILTNKLTQKSNKSWKKRGRNAVETRKNVNEPRTNCANRSIRSIILIVLCIASFVFYITLIAYMWSERVLLSHSLLSGMPTEIYSWSVIINRTDRMRNNFAKKTKERNSNTVWNVSIARL